MYIQKIISFIMLVNYWFFQYEYEFNSTILVVKIIINIITLFISPIIFGKLSLLFGTKPILLTTLFLDIINFYFWWKGDEPIIIGLSGNALIAGTLFADTSNLSNQVTSFRIIDFPLYIGIFLFFLRIESINFSLSIINFIIAFIFFKETNINIGITTDIISYIKIFSNPLVWSFLLFNIGWRLIYYYYFDVYGYAFYLMIIGGILFGPLSKFFGFNKLVIIGMIFGFLAILFRWFYDNNNKYKNFLTICYGLSFALVIPSLRASIINTYDYNNYGLVLGTLIGLQTLGWYMVSYLVKLFFRNEDNKNKELTTSTSLLIVTLVIFLIHGRTGVNLLEK